MGLLPDTLRKHFESALTPVVERLVAARMSPNVITTCGTSVLIGGSVAFAFGALRLGAGLLLLSGILDALDGKVARNGGRVTSFGAFYDSTLDRVGESTLFGGLALYFITGGVPDRWVVPAVSVTIMALAFGLIVSYARARAEGLGLDCKVGVAQRAERIVGLGVPTLFFGAGPDGLLLLAIVTLLAALSVVTVGQRVMHVYRLTRVVRRNTMPRQAGPILADLAGKGRRGE